MHSDTAYQAMVAAGGERAYSAQLQETTWKWMRANPGTSLRIALLHLRQLFLPQEWQFTVLHRSVGASLRRLLATSVGVFGLLGIGSALLHRRPYWVYPALLIALPALCLSLFQPVLRYMYLFYPILVFSSADLLSGLWLRARSWFRSGEGERPIPDEPRMIAG